MAKKSLMLLWRLFVLLGNIKHFDSGVLPSLFRAFAWDTACIYHQQLGRFPYEDWEHLTKRAADLKLRAEKI